MKSYFINIQGVQQGPLTLDELLDRDIGPDTPVWYSGAGYWKPAAEVAELEPLFRRYPPPFQVHKFPNFRTSRTQIFRAASGPEEAPVRRRRSSRRTLLIVLLVFAAIGVGAWTLMHELNGQQLLQHKAHKDKVQQIREREWQKAMEELKAARQQEWQLRQAKAKERQVILQKRKAELAGYKTQLSRVLYDHEEALYEMDDVQRPHLFRSRDRKAREIAAQRKVIKNLEAKAAALRAKIDKCNADITKLSADGVK